MGVGNKEFGNRYRETLAYAESLGQSVFVVGFEAKVHAVNFLASQLIARHPAFLTCSDTLTLANQTRNRELVRCVNSSLINGHVLYLRIDNGCDEDNVTGLISPLTSQDACGMRKETQVAFLRIMTSSARLPFLQPLANSHNLTPRQVDILKPFCTDFSIQNAGTAIGVTQQRAREMFCEIYHRLGIIGKPELIAFLGDLPSEPKNN